MPYALIHPALGLSFLALWVIVAYTIIREARPSVPPVTRRR